MNTKTSTRMAVSGIALMLGTVVLLMPVAQTVAAELTPLQVGQIVVGAFTFGGGLVLAISAAIVEELEDKLFAAVRAK